MCFASFCMHVEDHWSYSINYLHWGEPKTWYAVPRTSAESLERCMKRAAPELFRKNPNLLEMRITMLNPNILINNCIPVYRTEQYAGEFVVTFPRAYHFGCNQGLNVAEAVNFCPADWVKVSRECVKHYSTLKHPGVFSHDQIVCMTAKKADQLDLGVATACYLDMVEMINIEKKLRNALLEWGVTKKQLNLFEKEGFGATERRCNVCKTICFLSAVSCNCIRAKKKLCACTTTSSCVSVHPINTRCSIAIRSTKCL